MMAAPVARPVTVSRHGTARAVELDGEVGLVVEAPDGFRLRVLIPPAAAFRLANDLELYGEQVVTARERAQRIRRG